MSKLDWEHLELECVSGDEEGHTYIPTHFISKIMVIELTYYGVGIKISSTFEMSFFFFSLNCLVSSVEILYLLICYTVVTKAQ